MALIGNSVFPSSNPVLPHPRIKTRRSCSAISALKNGSRIEEGSSLWRGHYARRDINQHGILMSLMTNPDDFKVGRFIGDYGYMNITSYNSLQSGSFLDGGGLEDMSIGESQNDIDRLRVQDVQEGPVKIRLYDGRVALGIKKGTPVLFKVVEFDLVLLSFFLTNSIPMNVDYNLRMRRRVNYNSGTNKYIIRSKRSSIANLCEVTDLLFQNEYVVEHGFTSLAVFPLVFICFTFAWYSGIFKITYDRQQSEA